MHQRMCRQHGDLSANVLDDDPAADWDARGVTWQAFEYAKPALAGGLSSRCVQHLPRGTGVGDQLAIAVDTELRRSVIMGESGPIHLVQDALGLDAKLVPLWRAMARYADAQIGVALETGAAEGRGGGPPGENESELSAAEADRILAAHFSSR